MKKLIAFVIVVVVQAGWESLPDKADKSDKAGKSDEANKAHETTTTTKVVERPHPDSNDRPCCKAITAKCLSCAARTTVKEYCEDHPRALGCPKADADKSDGKKKTSDKDGKDDEETKTPGKKHVDEKSPKSDQRDKEPKAPSNKERTTATPSLPGPVQTFTTTPVAVAPANQDIIDGTISLTANKKDRWHLMREEIGYLRHGIASALLVDDSQVTVHGMTSDPGQGTVIIKYQAVGPSGSLDPSTLQRADSGADLLAYLPSALSSKILTIVVLGSRLTRNGVTVSPINPGAPVVSKFDMKLGQAKSLLSTIAPRLIFGAALLVVATVSVVVLFTRRRGSTRPRGQSQQANSQKGRPREEQEDQGLVLVQMAGGSSRELAIQDPEALELVMDDSVPQWE